MVSIRIDPPETIVLINQAHLFLEFFRPPVVFVGPRAPVLLASPRVTDLNELRAVAQLLRVVDREGVSIRHSKTVRVLVGASACKAGASDHPAVVHLTVDEGP